MRQYFGIQKLRPFLTLQHPSKTVKSFPLSLLWHYLTRKHVEEEKQIFKLEYIHITVLLKDFNGDMFLADLFHQKLAHSITSPLPYLTVGVMCFSIFSLFHAYCEKAQPHNKPLIKHAS